MNKSTLAAKLVLGQLSAAEIVAEARAAVAAGETGNALAALVQLEDAEPNEAESLLREWLREADVALPAPPDALNTVFDKHFADLVLGRVDLEEGIDSFFKHVYNARLPDHGPPPEEPKN
ncbi:MAG TPA: hypothetical protein VH762_02710 [Gemmatimonadaceae bacterium]|jgi:hypothetical protein